MRVNGIRPILTGLLMALLSTAAAQADLVAFKTHEGRYLSAAEGGGGQLTADRREAKGWETFRLIHLEGNRVLLLSERGYFVTAAGHGGKVAVDAWDAGEAEVFRLINLRQGGVALETYRGTYLSADQNNLHARGSRIGRNETFQVLTQEAAGPYGEPHGGYGSPGGSGSGPHGSPGNQSPYTLPGNQGPQQHPGGGQGRSIAIRANKGQLVSAGGSNGSLRADRLHISQDTVFELITLRQATPEISTIALRSDDGTYVSVLSDGRLRIGARRIGDQETFQLRQEAGGYSLRAANGRYVSAEDGGGRELVANRSAAKAWEIFRFMQVNGNGT